MGLFDKLKKLVSDDSANAGAIDIIAPLSGEIVNIEEYQMWFSLRKSLATVSRSSLLVTKW